MSELVPRLRFGEFSSTSWKELTLSSIAKIERGRFSPRPRNDPQFYGGIIPFAQTNDVSSSNGYVSKYSQTLNEKGLKVSKLFPEGTILMTIAANIGYCGVLSQAMACPDSLVGITCKNGINNYFLNFYLNREQPRIDFLAPRAAQKNINIEFLSPYKLIIPSAEQEQQKIADFLTSVDSKISQLTEKHRLLTQYKKGVMQQIFSQQLRFKDEDGSAFGEWEEVQLQDVFDICYGKDFKHLNKGNVPVLGTGGVMTFVDSYLYDKPSVLIGRKGTIDKPQFITSPFWTVDTLFYTKIKINYEPKFVFYICQMINWKKYNEATGVPSLNTTSINKIKVFTPNLIEQQKIIPFIEAIDAKIDATNQQLEQAKLFKKGLLQQMFV